MYINEIDISIYGASVSKKIVHPRDIFIEKEKIKINTIKIYNKIGLKKLTIKILFEGKSRDDAYKNISKFMGNLIDEFDIKFKNLSNIFHCYLNSSEIEDTEFDEWLYLNLEMDCYEYGTEKNETMNRITNKTINVSGNLETP
ncbi:MAG: hypothetical protein KH415_20065, partial [Clostridium sp.]|nr:hypothetical protein [Clostridium sp.]